MEEKLKKLAIVTLLTGIMLLLIGHNFSWSQKSPSNASKAESWFRAIDADGDGKISREEYLKNAEKRAEKNFRDMDVNKDGYVSKEEFKGTSKKRKKIDNKRKTEEQPNKKNQ